MKSLKWIKRTDEHYLLVGANGVELARAWRDNGEWKAYACIVGMSVFIDRAKSLPAVRKMSEDFWRFVADDMRKAGL